MDAVKSVPWVPSPAPAQAVFQGVRLDQRSCEQFRSVFINPGSLSRATGSVYAEFDSTKLMVAIYGPRASDRRSTFSEKGRLQVDVKYATFSTGVRGTAGQTAEERDLSLLLNRALEPSVQCHTFPKAVVDVYVTILESGGSDLAVAVSAASVALAIAGVELYDLVAACRVSIVNDELLLDSSLAEEAVEQGGMLLAQMPKLNRITEFVMQGQWTQTKINAALDLCQAGCAQLDVAMRECLRDHCLEGA